MFYKATVSKKSYEEINIKANVWVNKVIWNENDYGEKKMKYISFFGTPAQAKSAIAHIVGGNYAKIEFDTENGEKYTFDAVNYSHQTTTDKKVIQYIDIVPKRIMQVGITINNSIITVRKDNVAGDILSAIKQRVQTPIIEEKAKEIIDYLIENNQLLKLQSIGMPEEYEFYEISSYGNTDYLVRQAQNIEDPSEDDEEEAQWTLKDFLSEYREQLKEKVLSSLKPIHSKNNYTEEDKKTIEVLKSYPKKPKQGQIDPIVAAYKGIQKKKGLFIVGEMGVGKTYISIATTALMKSKRTVVMCPPHLTEKWAREVLQVIPDATVYDVSDMSITEIIQKGKEKPQGTEFWIIGRDKAKLHYSEKYIEGKEINDFETEYRCPKCGYKFTQESRKKVDKCENCGEPLWYADNTGIRRYAISLLLKKYVKFDLFIADEVHELKGGATAQGQALANLVAASKKVLALTGTLMGGYASNLFYLLWRVTPQLMQKISIPYSGLSTFVKKYGIFEEIETVKYEHSNSIGSKTSKRTKEKPGISPVLISMILENAIFIKLSDIEQDLPPYKEEVISVEMSDEQAKEYKQLESDLSDKVRQALARGSKALLGKMINSLYGYPDGARRGEVVKGYTEEIIASAKPIDDYLLPKEQQLLEIVKKEKENGRKCLILLEHTGTRDLMPDIQERLENEGISAVKLYSNTTTTKKREQWIKKHSDSDVLITNPRIVQTGLDLYEYPTIIFFQTGYSIFTLRQASRRSWRIGQKDYVKVYYIAYANTIQEKAMSLIASKLETALAVEGDLTDKGLAALNSADNSIVTELAKSIAGDSSNVIKPLDEIWKQAREKELMSDSTLQKEHKVTEDKTETTVSVSSTTKISVDDRKAELKFTVVSNVSVSNGMAKFNFDGMSYILKNNRIYLDKKSVGKYIWKKGKHNKKYASCYLYNIHKRIYIGEQNGNYVAIELKKAI